MIEQRNDKTDFLYQVEPYSRILNVLRDGEQNGIHLKDLITITGFQDRELRKLIEFIRRNGVVIIADNSGYYFPSDISELRSYLKRQESRAKSTYYTLSTAKNLESKLNKILPS